MTGILGQLKWDSLKKRRKDNRLILLYKGVKGKASVPTMTLSPKLGVVEISTLWHFRLPLLIQMFIKVASSPKLSGIGMPSPILWSHLLKMQRIVLLSSLLWWELGTNSLITGPGEWLSFRRFNSKLSWSWHKLMTHYVPTGTVRDRAARQASRYDRENEAVLLCWHTYVNAFGRREYRPDVMDYLPIRSITVCGKRNHLISADRP